MSFKSTAKDIESLIELDSVGFTFNYLYNGELQSFSYKNKFLLKNMGGAWTLYPGAYRLGWLDRWRLNRLLRKYASKIVSNALVRSLDEKLMLT